MSFVFERNSDSKLKGGESYEASEVYNFSSKRISNAKGQSEVQWKYFIFQSLLCFSNILCLICVSFLLNEANESMMIFDLCAFFSVLSCIFYILKVINEYRFYQLAYAQIYELQGDKLCWNVLVGLFSLVHPTSLAAGIEISVDEFGLKLNSILIMIVYLKVFSILHFLMVTSKFYGSRVARVLNIYAVKDGLSLGYVVRCFFKTQGPKMPLLTLILSLVLIPSMTLAFQGALGETSNFCTELYDTVITMTTVGYGDIGHSTSLITRAGIVLIILAGSFTSSLLTLTVINFFKLRPREYKAFMTQSRIQILQQMQKQQRRSIQKMIIGHKKSTCMGEASLTNSKISQNKNLLKQHRYRQSLSEFYNSQFIFIEREVKKIVEKQLLIDNLMQFYFERRLKGEAEVEEVKSGRSKKRADDSRKIGHLFEVILNVDE